MDANNYPTEKELAKVKEWDVVKDRDGLITYLLGLWHWDKYAKYYETKDGHTILELHTGGWSGNEEILDALRSNVVFWLMYFWIHKSGGHYYFNITRRIINCWPNKLNPVTDDDLLKPANKED
jgi:hypothetical protein